MAYEFFIARRYLRSKRAVKFISLITYISIFGIAIGSAALVIVLSVMNGFEKEVRSRIIGFEAHVKVRTYHNSGLQKPKRGVRKNQRHPSHRWVISLCF